MQKFGALIVGIIMLIAGVFLYFRNSTLQKTCTVEAEATVVDMIEDIVSDNDGISYMYYPVIEYIANGETIKEKMSSASNKPAYSINEKITILYNPNKTNEFIIKGDKFTNIFSIAFAIIGFAITIYGIKMAISKE